MSKSGKRKEVELPLSSPAGKLAKPDIVCDTCGSSVLPDDGKSTYCCGKGTYCCGKGCTRVVCWACTNKSTTDALLNADWGYDAVSAYCGECFRRLKTAGEKVEEAFMTAARLGVADIFFLLYPALPKSVVLEGVRTAIRAGHTKLVTEHEFVGFDLPTDIYREATNALVLSDEETANDD